MRKSRKVTRLQPEIFVVRFPIVKQGFLSSKTCRPALGPTQPRIQRVKVFPSLGEISRGVNLTNHFRPEKSLGISGSKAQNPT